MGINKIFNVFGEMENGDSTKSPVPFQDTNSTLPQDYTPEHFVYSNIRDTIYKCFQINKCKYYKLLPVLVSTRQFRLHQTYRFRRLWEGP